MMQKELCCGGDWTVVATSVSRIRKVANTILATFLMSVSAGLAAEPGYDSASDAVYAGGDNFNTLNGGSGFGDWQTSPSANAPDQGLFMGDSNVNGDSGGPGINSDNDTAFGIYANFGSGAEAIRPFVGPMSVSQTFTIAIDNGYLEGDDSNQGFGLRDAEGISRVDFFIRAGSGTYTISDADGEFDTGIASTDGGMVVSIYLTSEDTYDITVYEQASDSSTTFSERNLGGSPGAGIEQVRVYNINSSENTGPEYNFYVNYLQLGCADSAECAIQRVDGSDPACPGTQVTFAGPENGEEFVWTIENNSSGATIVGPDNQQSLIIDSGSEPGFYDLMLETIVDGCSQVCLVSMTVDGLSAPEAGNNGPICEGEDLILTAADIDGATYTWVGPDLFLSTDQNPVIIEAGHAAAGEYSVSASLNGCPSGISTTFVEINDTPDCLISGDDFVCPGTEEVVFYAPNDLVAYTWVLEGDAVLENSPDGGFVRVIPEASGSFTLTLTIEDNNGCSVTCVRTVTIGDEIAPEIQCPPEAFVNPGEDTSPESLGGASVFDGCDPDAVITFEDVEAPGDCSGSTLITRTWTAVDASGNSSSCDQLIYVQDAVAPVLTIPDSVNLTCGADTSPEALGFASASDASDASPVVTYSDESFVLDCDNYIVIERRWTAEDSCGNSSEEIQYITIEDTLAPVMVVPASTQVGLDGDVSPEALGFATATDNCDAEASIEYSDEIVEGACPSEYTITRYWFAFDSCGNLSEGIQLIQVGSGPVTIEAPAEVVVNCNDDMSPDALGFATAVDGLGQPVEVSFSDEVVPADCAGRYIILRNWQATDACGNVVDAQQTIIVDDVTGPVLTIPEDAVLGCTDDTSVEALGIATAEDGCDAAPVVTFVDTITPGETAGSYTIERSWNAIDACGNVTELAQMIVVSDDTAPELSIPENAEVDCNADTSVEVLGSASATDVCDAAPVISSTDTVVPGDCPGNYVIERLWSATDANGNVSESVQLISVNDTVAPILVVPADVALACGASSDPSSTGTATATDDCAGDVVVVYADEDIGSSIQRTWTAVDACGNSSEAIQTISVNTDNTAPVLVVPEDAAVGCGSETGTDVLGIAIASDACDNNPSVTFADTVVPGDCAGSYVIERLWTAEDANGNVAEALQIIVVSDTVAPVLVVPADVSLACGESSDPSNTGSATATDACSEPVDVTYVDEAVEGGIIRTWAAADACGNLASASQIITTSGEGSGGAPVITVDHIVVTSAFVGQPVNYPMPTASSDCDPNVSVVCTPEPGSIKGPGLYLITCVATDSAGNQATKKFKLVVLESLRVVVDSPLKDDNVANDVETDADKENKFQVGSTQPIKVRLLDSRNNDMTLLYGLTVSVKLDLTHRGPGSNGSVELADLPEKYSGTGWSNGYMAYKFSNFQYNLKTDGYPKGTEKNNTFIRALVTVESALFPGVILGQEDVLLESKK